MSRTAIAARIRLATLEAARNPLRQNRLVNFRVAWRVP